MTLTRMRSENNVLQSACILKTFAAGDREKRSGLIAMCFRFACSPPHQAKPN